MSLPIATARATLPHTSVEATTVTALSCSWGDALCCWVHPASPATTATAAKATNPARMCDSLMTQITMKTVSKNSNARWPGTRKSMG